MKLPFNLFKPKQKADYFLILFIKNKALLALIFESLDGNAKIVGKSRISLKNSFISETQENLLQTIDQLLANAENTLAENIQTQKTILAVSEDLVDSGKIKHDVLLALRKICNTLSLQPMGFLIYTESIISFLQSQEGAPLSAILVQVDDKITISLVRAGRVIESHIAPELDFLPTAVDESLKHFLNIEIFPSRIIVISNTNREQDFIKHSWSRDLPFIHSPQISFLDDKFVEKSVVYTTLNQLNLTLTSSLDTNVTTNTDEISNINDLSSDVDNFGFVKDEDIKNINQNFKYTQSENPIKEENFTTVPETLKETADLPSLPDPIENSVDIEEEKTQEKMKNNLAIEGGMIADKIRKQIKLLLVKVKKINLPILNNRKLKTNNKRFLGLIAVIAVILLLVLSWIFLTNATITIYFSPKVITTDANSSFTTSGPSDFANNQVTASKVSVDETGSINEKATGTKNVGTSAKGTVTIFSRLTDNTTIKANTNFTSDNGLVFTLDNDTQVSSFSGDPSDPSVTISNVSLTSSDIGDSYNLPSGTKFTISGYDSSQISAKNDNAFSGGSKKTETVVSKDDVQKAANDLINNLSNQAKNDISSKANGQFLVPSFINEQVTNQKLSANVNDQASNFTLSGTTQYQSLLVSKSDLSSYAKNLLQDKIPSNLLQDNLITYNISNLKTDSENVSFDFKAQARLVPSFDQKQLAESIKGKNLSDATKIITAINQVQSVNISLFPHIPLLPSLVPFFSNHINFKLQEQ